MMQLATIDIIVLIVYGIGIFGLAQYVSREKAAIPRMPPTTSWRRDPYPGGPLAPR